MNTGLQVLCAAVAAALFAGAAGANSGSVQQLSGTLTVRKADGSVKILSQKSEIVSGDTLSTERDTYAQVKFADGGQITLKPNTAIKIENFRFSEDKRQEDAFVFSLLKGGMRAVTGLVGKLDPDSFLMKIATGTVGIRGTAFSADDCVSRRDGECRDLEAAVFVSVSDGEIVVRNPQGEQAYRAGQFGLISPNQRPLYLSTDPGLQFVPPATFIRSVMAGTAVNAGKNLECVVRR